MSTEAVSSLVDTTTQITIDLGSVIFAMGVISNNLNIIVFLSLKTFRESSCAFYLTAMSFVNIGQMFLSLFPRILSVAWGADWSNTYLPYCKLRYYIFQVFAMVAYTCMYLATIDQYLATCSKPSWQRLSNIKLARVLFVIIFIVWTLHGIPLIIFYDHITSISTNKTVCQITNTGFQQYYRYGYELTLLGIIPVIITVSFGWLAYRNVKQLLYRTVPLVRRETENN